MAFNPFHSFRKHQKVLFALLTIVCMITFVLTFGAGDIFQRIGIGGGRGGPGDSPTATTLYGKKVSEYELDNLRLQRLLANNLIVQAMLDGQRGALKEFEAVVPRLKPHSRTAIEAVTTSIRQAVEPPDLSKIPHDKLKAQDIFLQQRMNQLRLLEESPSHLQRLEFVARDNPDEAGKVRQMMQFLLQFRWLMERSQFEFYFGGSTRPDELLDFLVWQRQADQLEINLTDADVRAEINNQTLSSDTLTGDAQKDIQRVGQYLKNAGYGQNRSISLDEVYAALRAELRVSMAQSALLGSAPGALSELERRLGVNEVPATVTPDQFYAYFRDNRTTFKVAMQPVPVKDFLDQVTDKPSEKELKALFKEYREQEPNPERDTPGFRQPRRVRVEWVRGKAESEHYKGLAAAAIGSVIGDRWAALSLVALAHLGQEYNFLKHSHKLPAWTEPSFTLPFYTSLNEAGNLAAYWGQLFNVAGSMGSPLTLIVSYQAGAAARDHAEQADAIAAEARERAPLAAAFVLAGLQPGPFATPATMLALYQHGSEQTRNLSYLALKKQVVERLTNRMANSLLSDNVNKLRKEVAERKGKPDKSGEWLAEAAKKYGLDHGKTPKALDQFQLDEDAAIKDLREALKDRQGPKFRMAEAFMGNDPSLYQPFRFDRNANEQFLYWKVEDTPGKSYTTYAEALDDKTVDMKAQVEQAWRYQQAREKARTATQQVEDAARKFNNADAATRYLRDQGAKQKWGELIELSNVSRLVRKPMARELFKSEYEPYQAPEDKFNARPNFVDDLLKSLNKPGDVTVVWNKPESIYYVVVLEQREEPSEADFVSLYRKTPEGDMMLERLDQEQRRKFREGVLEQLRREAGAEQGTWVVDADVRRRLEGRGRDGDE